MEVLSNKTAKTSEYFSRYNGLYYYFNDLDNKYQLQTGSWLKQIATVNGTQVYKVQKGDTWDKIALKFYKNPTYYWILCDYNRVIDPFVEPKVGDEIEIPTLGTSLQFESY